MFINFNPLPRKEGDWTNDILQNMIAISIHSLVKRETENLNQSRQQKTISIHSLVKRETQGGCSGCRSRGNFNPLPRKEGDGKTSVSDCLFRISIHSLVKRETIHDHKIKSSTKNFNPLPRKEGDASGVCSHMLLPLHFNPLPRKEGDQPVDLRFQNR